VGNTVEVIQVVVVVRIVVVTVTSIGAKNGRPYTAVPADRSETKMRKLAIAMKCPLKAEAKALLNLFKFLYTPYPTIFECLESSNHSRL